MLEEKLKYTIHFCKSIDTDDYARIALTQEPAADDSSDDSENEDVDSFASRFYPGLSKRDTELDKCHPPQDPTRLTETAECYSSEFRA